MVQLKLMGTLYLLVADHKPKYWTKWNLDLMMVQETFVLKGSDEFV